MSNPSLTDAIPIIVTSAACLVCATTDLRRFRVPNAVTLPLLASGLVYHAATAGWPGLRLGLVGAGFGFAVLFVPYALGIMGAGDVKLLAGIGAWLGQPLTSDVLLASVICGGLYALLLTATTGRLRRTFAEIGTIIARGVCRPEHPVSQVVAQPDRHGRLVPFAAMVALGLFKTIAMA
jgi:Flp pilus assembly protein protease CpaA